MQSHASPTRLDQLTIRNCLSKPHCGFLGRVPSSWQQQKRVLQFRQLATPDQCQHFFLKNGLTVVFGLGYVPARRSLNCQWELYNKHEIVHLF